MSSAAGGFAPATPTQKQNLSMKENQKQHPTPSRWSGQQLQSDYEKHLLERATKG